MARTPKKATRKDVLYALQFGHERLVKTILSNGSRWPCEYHLSGSGLRVEMPIGNEVINDPHVVPLDDGLFPGSSQQFVWQDEAMAA